MRNIQNISGENHRIWLLPNGRFSFAFPAICGTRDGSLSRISAGICDPSNVCKGLIRDLRRAQFAFQKLGVNRT